MKEKEILDEIRRWLKEGCTIKATDKNGKILELMPDGSCYGGMTIVGENSERRQFREKNG